MMSADWLFCTVFVVTVKVALVAPAGTVTLAGTLAAAVLSLESATVNPPAGAAAVSVTVPVDVSATTTAARLRSRIRVCLVTIADKPPRPGSCRLVLRLPARPHTKRSRRLDEVEKRLPGSRRRGYRCRVAG